MRRLLTIALVALTVTLLADPAQASPDDPVNAVDVLPYSGLTDKLWDHFGNSDKGSVYAQSWVDLHWPCFDATDEDQTCTIEDVRGHGTVERVYKVKRMMVDRVRVREYPSGVVLAQNDADTPISQRTLPLVEGRTAWVPVEGYCGRATFRAWSRISFLVRWSDNWLSSLSLLSDPTEDMAASICEINGLSASERKALHDRLKAS